MPVHQIPGQLEYLLRVFHFRYNEMLKSTLNVEFLCNDSAILLPPTGTPLTGISFTRRLPCGEVEKARRAIRVFFLLRRMCQTITGEQESLLPLTNPAQCVQIENALDLSMLLCPLKRPMGLMNNLNSVLQIIVI